MKKFITLVWMLTALCGVSMADNYYVTGSFNNWSEFVEMTNVNGIYKLTVNNVDLTSNTKLEYKITSVAGWDNDKDQFNNFLNGKGYNLPNAEYIVENPGTYDVTFMLNPEGYNGYYSNCSVAGDGLYIVYKENNGEWTVGEKLTAVSNTYTATINGTPDMLFMFAPAHYINEGNITNDAWRYMIRPVSQNYYDLYAQHMPGSTITIHNDKVWYIKETATFTFTYYSGSNSFISEATMTANMGTAGWRTFSAGAFEGYNGYTITGDNVAAYYVSSTADGKAVLTAIDPETIIPTRVGVLLKGNGDFTITTTETNGTALSGNMLVGSGSYTYNINNDGYTGYVLANKGEGLGFYPVNMSGSDKTLAANKAFLRIPNGGGEARAFDFIGLGDESTGIKAIDNEQMTMDNVYDLSGRKIVNGKSVNGKLQSGLYIVNGKKVIIK